MPSSPYVTLFSSGNIAMTRISSAISRILAAHRTDGARTPLVSPHMATTATLLLCVASPALADCALVQYSNCSWGGGGSTGSGAPGPGENGGNGGPGPIWTLDIDNYHFVDDPVALYSPINITSTGGDGAQAADGHLTGGGKESGGNGGTGGVGGDITITTGPGMKGTTSSIASGITLGTVGGAGGEGSFGALNHSPGVGGTGGAGGHIIANLSGDFPDNLSNQSRAIDMWSLGGNGG